MAELEQIERVVQGICDGRGMLASGPMFQLIDAVYRHVASEELLFGESSDFLPPPEWNPHRVHHARARLCCFWMATCNEADRCARFKELQSVLSDHALHEMLLLSGLVGVLTASQPSPRRDRRGLAWARPNLQAGRRPSRGLSF